MSVMLLAWLFLEQTTLVASKQQSEVVHSHLTGEYAGSSAVGVVSAQCMNGKNQIVL